MTEKSGQDRTIPPGSTVGILGGGQLGRMLAVAAAQLGYRTHILAPDRESVAAQTASSLTRADYHNRIVLADFAAAGHLSALDYIGDVDWGQNESAKQWYARMKSRPSFRALLAERVSGLEPPPHYDDPDF